MKAIIMAGGEGQRLRPLTCDCPKPMMRLMDRPVMEYALKLLHRHGVREAAATLGYLPDTIVDFFGDGSDWGLHLRYYTERVPLGTAGGVRQAADFLDETFCVLSGDGVTDLDLSEALRFHQEKKALVTIVLTRVESPTEYGVVVTSQEGRVRNFQEKPGPGEVISDTINTGIYILEPEVLKRIPEGKPCDFGGELFPQMVAAGEAVYGCVLDGYWCDIGDVSAYLRAHVDLLDGKLSLDVPRGVQRGALVDEDAIIEEPCYIGPLARVSRGAHIGPYSVIGAEAVVEANAGTKRAVLWRGARMERGAQARMCVLASNARMEEDSQAFEESALGSCAVLGARAQLMPSVKVWPCKGVADGERVEDNLVWGSRAERSFSEGSLPICDPSAAARAAQALAADLKPREVLLAHTRSAVSLALFHACAAGLMSQGVQVIDAGSATLPQLRYALSALGSDAAALVDNAFLTPIAPNGALLPRKRQRSIASLLARQDFSGPFTGITRPMAAAGRTDLFYTAALARAFRGNPENAPPVAIFAEDAQLLSLAEKAFSRAGLRARCEWEEEMMELDGEEIGIWLSSSGEGASFTGPDGTLSEAEEQLLLLFTALEMGERNLILPASFTRAAEKLAERYGAQVRYEAAEPARWMEALARESALQFGLHFDGIHFALSALSALSAANLTLGAWRESMPKVHRQSRVIEMALKDRARALRAFTESEPEAELLGGIRLMRDRGWAFIAPDEKRPLCKIVSESADAEFASELCDFCEKTLKQKLGSK